MSEAEVLALRSAMTGLVISVVSVSFGMVSAYIAGLWLFLRDAPLSLRFIAFMVLSLGLLFMGAIAWGLHDLLLGTDRAWSRLPDPATGIPHFGGERPDMLGGLTLYEASAALGLAAFGAIYLALAYMTFGYRWPRTPDRN